METKLLTAKEVNEAGKILKNGGLVGIPTETVYGLAANALDGTAVAKIFAAKGRPQDNPLIVHISRLSQLDDLVAFVPPVVYDLADVFWPGPLTIIMEKSGIIPDEVSARQNRCSSRRRAVRCRRGVYSNNAVYEKAEDSQTGESDSRGTGGSSR